jgi:hypothetical protein
MAARRGRVAVSITADNASLKKGVKDSEKQLGRLQRVGVSSTRGLSAGFKAAGGIIAGAAVADQIRQTITAAQESQTSQAKLAAQLKASGISYKNHAKEIDNVIQKTSRLAGLDDEDLQDAFTAVVRSTGSVNTAMKDMAVVADLARAKHMDVGKAGELVAKIHAGNVGALKRLGIAIAPVTAAQDKLKESNKHATVEQQRAAKEADKTATAQKALGELQKRVGGQAAAYGKTSAGAQDRFRVAVENLRESIGKKLVPILTDVTKKATKFVEQMQDGTGAGGRFVDKLKAIADRIKPIVKFFTEHPKIVAVAVGAWVAYRVAAATAIAITRAKALGIFKGLARPAAVEGAKTGTAFGTASSAAAEETSVSGFRRAGRAGGRAFGRGLALGAIVGLAGFAEAIYREIKKQIDGLGNSTGAKLLKSLFESMTPGHTLLDKLGLPSPGDLLPGLPDDKPKKPKKSAAPTPSPAAGGTPLPVKPAPHPGTTRAHTASVRAHAASVVASTRTTRTVTAHAASRQPSPNDIVAAITQRANRIDAAHVGYSWGGGHDKNHATGKVVPMDCSGAVSAALGIDPRVSGDFVTWGSPGDGGSRGVTIYANRTHVLMKINGRFWGTSRSNPGGGPGWIDGGVSAGYLSGFTARHMAGSDSASLTATTVASTPTSRPKTLTAALGGTTSRAPGRALGAKRPKATGSAFLPGLRPTDAQGTARLMRLFQIGNRRNKILSDINSGRIKSPATLQRLAGELGDLDTEKAGLLGTDVTGVDAIPGATAYLGSLDRAGAEAALTPDGADDADVARRVLAARQSIYDYEKARPGQFSDADVTDAAQQLKTARDAVDQTPTADNTDAIKALTDELKRTNDINQHVLGVTSGQWQRAFADIVSGQIAGVDYAGRRATAGDGRLANY